MKDVERKMRCDSCIGPTIVAALAYRLHNYRCLRALPANIDGSDLQINQLGDQRQRAMEGSIRGIYVQW